MSNIKFLCLFSIDENKTQVRIGKTSCLFSSADDTDRLIKALEYRQIQFSKGKLPGRILVNKIDIRNLRIREDSKLERSRCNYKSLEGNQPKIMDVYWSKFKSVKQATAELNNRMKQWAFKFNKIADLYNTKATEKLVRQGLEEINTLHPVIAKCEFDPELWATCVEELNLSPIIKKTPEPKKKPTKRKRVDLSTIPLLSGMVEKDSTKSKTIAGGIDDTAIQQKAISRTTLKLCDSSFIDLTNFTKISVPELKIPNLCIKDFSSQSSVFDGYMLSPPTEHTLFETTLIKKSELKAKLLNFKHKPYDQLIKIALNKSGLLTFNIDTNTLGGLPLICGTGKIVIDSFSSLMKAIITLATARKNQNQYIMLKQALKSNDNIDLSKQEWLESGVELSMTKKLCEELSKELSRLWVNTFGNGWEINTHKRVLDILKIISKHPTVSFETDNIGSALLLDEEWLYFPNTSNPINGLSESVMPRNWLGLLISQLLAFAALTKAGGIEEVLDTSSFAESDSLSIQKVKRMLFLNDVLQQDNIDEHYSGSKPKLYSLPDALKQDLIECDCCNEAPIRKLEDLGGNKTRVTIICPNNCHSKPIEVECRSNADQSKAVLEWYKNNQFSFSFKSESMWNLKNINSNDDLKKFIFASKRYLQDVCEFYELSLEHKLNNSHALLPSHDSADELRVLSEWGSFYAKVWRDEEEYSFNNRYKSFKR